MVGFRSDNYGRRKPYISDRFPTVVQSDQSDRKLPTYLRSDSDRIRTSVGNGMCADVGGGRPII